MTSLVSTNRIGLTELKIRIYTERGQELAFLRVVSRQNPDPGCRGIVPSYAYQNYKFPHVPPPCPCLKFNKPALFLFTVPVTYVCFIINLKISTMGIIKQSTY